MSTAAVDWEARARAAERTVDVLKRKVQELYRGGTAFQRAAARAHAREGELRRRSELAAMRNDELIRHGARLASEVAARTRDLRMILDNVSFGFLVIQRDGTIRDGFTRSCTTLLGREQLARARLVDLLGFPEPTRQMFELGLELLSRDLLPEEIVLEQLPRRTTSATGRALQLDGRALRAVTGELEGVLFTIADVTAVDAAERENAHYRLLVTILRDRDAWEAFVADVRGLAAAGRAAARASDPSAARRAVHTIKGNAACFGLTSVADCAHEAENQPAITAADLDRIELALDAFLVSDAAVLGPATGARATVHVSEEELATLEAVASEPAVADWIAWVRRRPARALLGPLETLVPRLAERFEKQVALVIEGGDLRVDPAALGPILRELGHVVRNAVDHGIEPPGERGGKPETGTVWIRITERAAAYRVEVEDDGRGIDVDQLVAKACATGLCEPEQLTGRTREELLDLVFLDGLSTAVSTTDVSGRGVGMAALRAAVLRAGGTLRLWSEPGRGTRFDLTIPIRRAAGRHVAA